MLSLKILDDFIVKTKINVSWNDMDILGHVNSCKYFTYFESARIKYYEHLNLWDYFSSENIMGVVAKTECNYFISLTYPDKLIIGARITEILEDFLIQEYYIESKLHGLSAIGEANIVFLDRKKNKKILVPEYIIEKISDFEQEKVIINIKKK